MFCIETDLHYPLLELLRLTTLLLVIYNISLKNTKECSYQNFEDVNEHAGSFSHVPFFAILYNFHLIN